MLSKLTANIMKNISHCGFSAYEHENNNALEDNCLSHSHELNEIFFLLDGKLDYFADGSIFPLSPSDCIIIGSHIPHGKNHVHTSHVKFFVLLISNNFFAKNNCTQYKNVFFSRRNTEHKISADDCAKSGFTDAFFRLKKYTNDFSNTETPIANSLIIEMLHILNNHTEFAESYIENKQVQKIFDYINENFREKITLEDISDALFLSKYHMCKLFKKYVGCTIYQHITQKRLAYAKKLVNEGKFITTACIEAGFSDYSSFYKAYVKENGTSINNKKNTNL